jgi:hypothetical protein
MFFQDAAVMALSEAAVTSKAVAAEAALVPTTTAIGVRVTHQHHHNSSSSRDQRPFVAPVSRLLVQLENIF